MQTYTIQKKRDGQNWEKFGEIYAADYAEAKKEFSLKMTQDNWEKSNNIVWLNKDNDGVKETGWYDFNGGTPLYNEVTEKYDADKAEDFLMVSEADINEGFDTWSEDVYSYRLLNVFNLKITDIDDDVTEESYSGESWEEILEEVKNDFDYLDIKSIEQI